ncbi:MAG: TIGR04076 family protein [Dehalococcoidia bacterium]|nr:TIGR04076 family protein [Dehalococcoidia bacterium]
MAEAEFYEVEVQVISQKGTCVSEHKVGDKFIIADKTPPGMCAWAFYTLFPFISALQFGGSFPWENDQDKATVACPDPTNPVIFELRRVRK